MDNISQINIYGKDYSVGKVTGVKGNMEIEYRDGDINLSPANIGAVDKAGDKMDGNLTIGDYPSTMTGIGIGIGTEEHSGVLEVGSETKNFGLYDTTHNKWIVYSDPTGKVTLNGEVSKADTANSATTAGSATTATTASQLTTARTIQTNLASTTAASFNGTANVNPGVTGVLEVGNGGTGNNAGYIRTGQKSGFEIGNNSTIEGKNNIAKGDSSHAEGRDVTAMGFASHAEGYETRADGQGAHAEGYETRALGSYSHAEGKGMYSLVNGISPSAEGQSSHVEGQDTYAKEIACHAEGAETQALGMVSHAEGIKTKAIGDYSHAEGQETDAFGKRSHAGGYKTVAYGEDSYAGGSDSQAWPKQSFVHGKDCLLKINNDSYGIGGFMAGIGLRGGNEILFDDNNDPMNYGGVAFGTYNFFTGKNSDSYGLGGIFVIGGGTSDSDRKNLLKIDKTGEQYIRSNVTCPTDAKKFYFNSDAKLLTDYFNFTCMAPPPFYGTSSSYFKVYSSYNNVSLNSALWCVEHGQLLTGNSVNFYMPVSYINSVLVRIIEITTSSNAIYGQHLLLWTCGPHGSITSTNVYASSNAGVSFAAIASDGEVAGRTITANSSRTVYYCIYRFCI